MTKRSAAEFPYRDWPVGTRVIFSENAERYPHFTVPKGTTGTVVSSDRWGVSVHVDGRVPGLTGHSEWKGDFQWDDASWGDDPQPPFRRHSDKPSARAERLAKSILSPSPSLRTKR
ncbi:MAG: hypothetical protein ACHREM_08930 [Polyangiales bacterium]